MTRDNSTHGTFWVIIETGANQRYIFGTNKRRANIGASELVHRVGTQWVHEALKTSTGVTPVVTASGKAILMASSEQQGKDVITSVTTKALEEAPGLGVWGVVRAVTPDGDRGLKAAHEAISRVRADGSPPELRFPTIPFTQPCVPTGLPASTTGSVGADKGQAWSRQFDSVFRVVGSRKVGPSTDGLNRLRRIVRTGTDEERGSLHRDLEHAVPTLDPAGKKDPAQDSADVDETEPPDLDPVQNRGWIAIVHADGNGIGNLFLNIGAKFADADLQRTMQAFSTELNSVTCRAVHQAAAKAAETFKKMHAREPEGWILPVIVGGDDVTVIIDARMALDFTEAFLAAFQELAGEASTIAKVNRAIHGEAPPPVTASAGIVFIKPHHPFSDGYDLAEQLCSSAKALTKARGNESALDYHVLFDSVGRDVEAIREPGLVNASESGSLRLWSGPVLLSEEPSIGTLRTAVGAFGKASSTVSSAGAHAVRSSLAIGGRRITDTLSQRGLDGQIRGLVEADDPTQRADKMSWVLDALALDEVARGTSR